MNSKIIKNENLGPIRQMWPEGPLRQFSETPFRTWGKTANGYAAQYVCADCGKAVVGVYKVDSRYVCSGCKGATNGPEGQ